jgi:hypothetical protein
VIVAMNGAKTVLTDPTGTTRATDTRACMHVRIQLVRSICMP